MFPRSILNSNIHFKNLDFTADSKCGYLYQSGDTDDWGIIVFITTLDNVIFGWLFFIEEMIVFCCRYWGEVSLNFFMISVYTFWIKLPHYWLNKIILIRSIFEKKCNQLSFKENSFVVSCLLFLMWYSISCVSNLRVIFL